jgi:hypothetical protein
LGRSRVSADKGPEDGIRPGLGGETRKASNPCRTIFKKRLEIFDYVAKID